MRLHRVTITNHARVPDMDFQVHEHLVLIGPNECGKSSILRTLSTLLSGSQAQLYSYFTPDMVADPNSPLVVEVLLTDVVDEDGTWFPHEITVLEDKVTRQLRIRLEVAVDSADPTSVNVSRMFPESGHSRGASQQQIAALRWRFLPAQRGGAIFSADHALRTLLGELDIGEATLDSFKRPLRQFNVALDAAPEVKTLRSGIANHMSSAMPRLLSEEGVKVQATADPDQDPLAEVSLFLKSDKGVQSAQNQSDGVRQVVAMTLHDLAFRGASMLAVDEPEVHLHPSSQRTVANMFMRSSNQKIVATHSPYIVHAFEPQHVVAVTKRGCTTMKTPQRLNDAEKLRAHWWSPQLLEALTAQHVIFVEGVADRVIVESTARMLDLDLQRLGILVFDLRGADNFPHVYGLLGPSGFDLRWSGLVDEDHKHQWLGKVGGKPNNVLNKLIWVSDRDLEDEYCRAMGPVPTADALEVAGITRVTGLLQAGKVSRLEDLPTEVLANKCRSDKVGAAAAISAALRPEHAKGIASVHGLLEQWIVR